MNEVFKAKVKRTGEPLEVYQLINGNYYDYKAISMALPPTARKARKKEFKKSELIFEK